MNLVLKLQVPPRQVEVTLVGANVAELTGQLPEVINSMLRVLAADSETDKKALGIISD